MNKEQFKTSYPSESSRWYNINAEVVDKVLSADGSKYVRPDIRHAEKHTLYPSDTSVIKDTVAKPSIVSYRIDCIIDACIKVPIDNFFQMLNKYEGVNESDYKSYIKVKADEHRNQTSEIGKKIHAILAEYVNDHGIDKFFTDIDLVNKECKNELCKDVLIKVADKIHDKFIGCTFDFKTEHSFINRDIGFGATADLVVQTKPPFMPEEIAIFDYKSTDLIEYQKRGGKFVDWELQLGAYSLIPSPEDYKGVYLFQVIIDRETFLGNRTLENPVLIKEYTNVNQLRRLFINQMKLWIYKNPKQYDPSLGRIYSYPI